MEAFLDFEEKSVEKAVQKACVELNIPKEKLKYDIISYGSSGIFGLVGAKKALIRVAVPEHMRQQSVPETSEKDLKETENSVIYGHAQREAVTALVDEAFGELEEKDVVEPADFESGIRVAREFLEKILELLSTDVLITIEKDMKHNHICIKGDDSGLLIGKKGQTLEAIQYLIDKVVTKQCGKGPQIAIDVEGYIETRKAELKELAKRLAEKTLRTGRPSTISRMNAQERRIVHLALKNNRSVRTQSVGVGYYRKLIIFPKKRAPKKRTKETSGSE